ncbi:MAG: cysteine-rich CWC family protein [Prosthecochloris sp.]|uniref:cysteine-rich CWC family protein n=1 Tax=Prosthecochloris sp. TaxID=290513 RepID=UPI00258F0459|nr:cysteine-rich CWC family protein [Prosthecochloris sp.]MCW8798081.1 cysteine-rich CWC family protein [Prosthecochloris sp.]
MNHSSHEGSGGPKSVTCPRCGKAFECRLAGDCWCASVDVSEAIRRSLVERYDTCICRTCLEELIEKEDRSQGFPARL